ncbi:MAG: serine/threonine protein kinase [Myxococcales bacterium]|nr:serine/threonine protein kinase [Myxococcales bacterium]
MADLALACRHCAVLLEPEARGAQFCPACGSRTEVIAHADTAGLAAPPGAATSPPPRLGQLIAGRYRLDAVLGVGGMGTVYRGEQIALKRPVAVKLVNHDLCRNPSIVARFLAEAETVARLNHPNIVTLYDFGTEPDGSLYLVMEFLPGRSLRHVLAEQKSLPVAQAVEYVMQVARAVAYANKAGVIHRDLKPDNIVLAPRGESVQAVVLDFGIAKLRGTDGTTVQPMTRVGDMIGTPLYMAPEQIRGEPVDARTDVYSLTAVLFELITGELPFTGPTATAIMAKHLTEAVPRPSQRVAGLAHGAALDHVIAVGMHKEPTQRFGDMGAFAHALATTCMPVAVFSGASLTPPVAASSPSGYAATAAATPVNIVRSRAPSPRPSPSLPTWLAPVAIAVLGVIGVGMYFWEEEPAASSAQAVPQNTGTHTDPWAGGSPKGSDDADDEVAHDPWGAKGRDLGEDLAVFRRPGYVVSLPSTISTAPPLAAGTDRYVGMWGGTPVDLSIAVEPIDSRAFSDEAVLMALGNIAEQAGAEIVDDGGIRYLPIRPYCAIMAWEARELMAEACVYRRMPTITAYFATTTSQFGSTAALRGRFFAEHLRF